jgi:hypothetical protein
MISNILRAEGNMRRKGWQQRKKLQLTGATTTVDNRNRIPEL